MQPIVKSMPQIETARLILRPITLRDLDRLQALVYGNDEATQYLPGGKAWSIAETQTLVSWWVSHWQSRGFGPWAVIEKDTGDFIGDCGLMYMVGAAHGIELMYAFGKESWGRGIATEAARAAVRHGFEAANVRRITALAEPANIGSRRVMEKIGMSFEGISAKYLGADLALYTINRAQFQADGSMYELQE
jgi:ribosomal-protein-alanine N-acetyltransferase